MYRIFVCKLSYVYRKCVCVNEGKCYLNRGKIFKLLLFNWLFVVFICLQENVVVFDCDVCELGSFNFDFRNLKGCIKCFCFGIIVRCDSFILVWGTVSCIVNFYYFCVLRVLLFVLGLEFLLFFFSIRICQGGLLLIQWRVF